MGFRLCLIWLGLGYGLFGCWLVCLLIGLSFGVLVLFGWPVVWLGWVWAFCSDGLGYGLVAVRLCGGAHLACAWAVTNLRV